MRVVTAILASGLLAAVMMVVFLVDATPLAIVATGCSALLGQVIHVYAHELGHLAAALSMRFRVTEVAILARPGDGAQIAGATVRLGLFGATSEVRVAVPAGQATRPARLVVYALAGPVTNLALAAATGLAMWALRGHFPAGDGALVGTCLVAATAPGVLIGLASLIPMSTAGQPSDGRIAVDWLLRREATQPSVDHCNGRPTWVVRFGSRRAGGRPCGTARPGGRRRPRSRRRRRAVGDGCPAGR